jgi:hypothetical protein
LFEDDSTVWFRSRQSTSSPSTAAGFVSTEAHGKGAMVQFTIEYIALGCAVLLVLGGILALISLRSNRTGISPMQRLALVGGVVGMLVFMVASAFWRSR